MNNAFDRSSLARALDAQGLRARNWTFAPHAAPCFAVYADGDSFVGTVTLVGGSFVADERHTTKRERAILSELCSAYRAGSL